MFLVKILLEPYSYMNQIVSITYILVALNLSLFTRLNLDITPDISHFNPLLAQKL